MSKPALAEYLAEVKERAKTTYMVPRHSPLRDDVEALVGMVALLDERADHDMTCDVVLAGGCDCGYAEVRRRLEALVPEEKP